MIVLAPGSSARVRVTVCTGSVFGLGVGGSNERKGEQLGP